MLPIKPDAAEEDSTSPVKVEVPTTVKSVLILASPPIDKSPVVSVTSPLGTDMLPDPSILIPSVGEVIVKLVALTVLGTEFPIGELSIAVPVILPPVIAAIGIVVVPLN